MTGLSKFIDINHTNYYNDPAWAMRILATYIRIYKEYKGFTWERVASELETSCVTLRKIRKAADPIRASLYHDLFQRLLAANCPRPVELASAKTDSSIGEHYQCYPNCPFKDFFHKHIINSSN